MSIPRRDGLNIVIFRDELRTLELGLEDRLGARVGLLSGGQRQALSLVMASFTQPQILLLDEHTAALDPQRAALITPRGDPAHPTCAGGPRRVSTRARRGSVRVQQAPKVVSENTHQKTTFESNA